MTVGDIGVMLGLYMVVAAAPERRAFVLDAKAREIRPEPPLLTGNMPDLAARLRRLDFFLARI